MRKSIVFLSALFIMCVMSLSCYKSKVMPISGVIEADFFIVPNGNDADSGTLNAPFATLGRARDAVRQLKKSSPDKDIRVLIRGGTYYLSKTVVFGSEDSQLDGHKIIYASFPNETPVFSSGVRIDNWKNLAIEDEPCGLPSIASGHIWVTDAPKQLGSFKTLYDGDKELPRARGKGFQPSQEWNDPNGKVTKLHYPAGAIKNWHNLGDVEIVIRPMYPWLLNILPLESVDEVNNVATTALESTYNLTKVWWRTPIPESVWVENVIEALDEPGEWVLNTSTGKLYLWPTGSVPGDKILAPALTEFIRVEGDEKTKTPVRNLVFHGLTFTQGQRDTWTKDEVTIQNEWESYDKANAMVRLRCTEKCVIKNCTFTNSASSGIRLDLLSIGNSIYGSKFEYLGGTGIFLCGYGPGNTDLNKNNEIVNNEIHHIGRHYWHSPGILLFQSGSNRIAHNLVHHVPYSAIMISGMYFYYFTPEQKNMRYMRHVRWDEISELPKNTAEYVLPFMHTRDNIIELNEVHDALQVLGDGNAIYIWFSPPGNIIRRNYVHHITSDGCLGAIRCDDFQTGVRIYENVIYKCARLGITVKGTNYINNNIIADMLIPGEPENIHNVELDGYIQLERNYGTDKAVCHGSELQRNIFYTSGQCVNFWSDNFDNLKDCQSNFNLYYCRQDPNRCNAYLATLRAKGIDANSISADPMFVDIEHGDFRLQQESPVLKLGFKQIDVAGIGLIKE